MVKQKNQKNKFLYLGLISVAIVLAFFAFKAIDEKTYNLPTNNVNYSNSKTYTSKTLKFTITLPPNYEVSEGINALFIRDKTGNEIRITRQGTNYNALKEYLISLGSVIADKTETQINDLPAVIGLINDIKYYFLYVNNSVYSISTSSKALFGDLDQIARSFRYTP